MSVPYNEALLRDSRRVQILRDVQEMKTPSFCDPAAERLHAKVQKELRLEFMENCTAIGEDFKAFDLALRDAAKRLGTTPEILFDAAWRQLHIPDDTLDKLALMRAERNQKAVEDMKARGEVPGQIKFDFDPNKQETAEAAGPMITRPLGAGE